MVVDTGRRSECVAEEESKRRLEQHVVQEIVMEQIQTGLSRELQTRIDARGPRTLEELQHCTREYQLHCSHSPPQHAWEVYFYFTIRWTLTSSESGLKKTDFLVLGGG